MKKLLAMLLAMVMVFSLAACAQGGTTNGVSATEKTAAPDNNGEKDSSTSTGDSDSIDVGVCLTITGSGAPNGLIMLAGVQEYVDMVNEKGGVNGKQIKLHIQDAGNDSDACLNAMKRKICRQSLVLTAQASFLPRSRSLNKAAFPALAAAQTISFLQPTTTTSSWDVPVMQFRQKQLPIML